MTQEAQASLAVNENLDQEAKIENDANPKSSDASSKDMVIVDDSANQEENNPFSMSVQSFTDKLIDNEQKSDQQDADTANQESSAQVSSPNSENMGTTIPDAEVSNENQESETVETNRSSKSTKSNHSNQSLSIYTIQADPKEVEASLASLIKFKTIPIEQLRDPVIQLINHKKLDAIIDRDYEQAEKYEGLLELLQQNGADEAFEKSEQRRQMSLDDRSDSINQKIQKVQNSYDTKIEKLEQERKESIQKLQAQQENDNQQFRQKWQDPNFLSKYKHPSQELLNLRFIEKKLAMSKCYDEAKEKKILADKQQKIEEMQTQQIVEEEMTKEFFKLKEAQVQEIKKIYDYYEYLIQQQQQLKSKEIQALRCSLNQIEIKKNTATNKKLHCIPLELTELNRKDTDTSLPCKTSPRTASKMAQFRNENKQKLKVTPLSDNTFNKLISSHPIIRPQSKFKPHSNPVSRLRRL